MIIDNDLLSIQHARVLAEKAAQAHKELSWHNQEFLDAIVQHAAQKLQVHAKELITMAQHEVGLDNEQEALLSVDFLLNRIIPHFATQSCVGLLEENTSQGFMRVGVPLGVVVAVTPMINAVACTAHAILMAIKSGNALLVSPHPCAEKSTQEVVRIMREAAEAHGYPQGCIAALEPSNTSGAMALIQHPNTALILNYGVQSLLLEIQKTGKLFIHGSAGQGPVFIERTANINQAASDIITSKSFDYGMAPAAEHAIVVEACIADDVRLAFQREGAYFLSKSEAQLITDLFIQAQNWPSPLAGLSAVKLALRAGIQVPEHTRLLIVERQFVQSEDPFAYECLAPIVSFYVEDDWMHACEKCIELLLGTGRAHSLAIHSQDSAVIQQFIMKKPVDRLLINTPASFGGMGYTTSFAPSLLLSGIAHKQSNGQGASLEGAAIGQASAFNVTPKDLTYVRQVGEGIYPLLKAPVVQNTHTSSVGATPPTQQGVVPSYGVHGAFSGHDVQLIQNIVRQIIKAL